MTRTRHAAPLLLTSVLALSLGLSACSKKHKDEAAQTADNAASATSDAAGAAASKVEDAAKTAMATLPSPAFTPTAATEFVPLAAQSDMLEIQSGELALKRARTPAVRKFAAQMVAAHKLLSAGMMKAVKASGLAITPPAALDDQHQAKLDALKAATDQDFEDKYIDAQRQAHAQAEAAFDKFSTDGDNPTIKAAALTALPKIRSHLDMVKALDASDVNKPVDAALPDKKTAGQ